MSTTTVKRPEKSRALPDWRRLCHYYDWAERRSLCGVGTRELGEYHFEAECRSRGHTICVVCTGIIEDERQDQLTAGRRRPRARGSPRLRGAVGDTPSLPWFRLGGWARLERQPNE